MQDKSPLSTAVCLAHLYRVYRVPYVVAANVPTLCMYLYVPAHSWVACVVLHTHGSPVLCCRCQSSYVMHVSVCTCTLMGKL